MTQEERFLIAFGIFLVYFFLLKIFLEFVTFPVQYFLHFDLIMYLRIFYFFICVGRNFTDKTINILCVNCCSEKLSCDLVSLFINLGIQCVVQTM